MRHPSPRVPTTGGKHILFQRSSLHHSMQPVLLQEDRKYLRCKAACAPFADVGGNEIIVQVPRAHVGGNELSLISRRCIPSSFQMVGPASDNAAPKSTSLHHRRKAHIVSPKFPARQLAASVPTRNAFCRREDAYHKLSIAPLRDDLNIVKLEFRSSKMTSV